MSLDQREITLEGFQSRRPQSPVTHIKDVLASIELQRFPQVGKAWGPAEKQRAIAVPGDDSHVAGADMSPGANRGVVSVFMRTVERGTVIGNDVGAYQAKQICPVPAPSSTRGE